MVTTMMTHSAALSQCPTNEPPPLPPPGATTTTTTATATTTTRLPRDPGAGVTATIRRTAPGTTPRCDLPADPRLSPRVMVSGGHEDLDLEVDPGRGEGRGDAVTLHWVPWGGRGQGQHPSTLVGAGGDGGGGGGGGVLSPTSLLVTSFLRARLSPSPGVEVEEEEVYPAPPPLPPHHEIHPAATRRRPPCGAVGGVEELHREVRFCVCVLDSFGA